MTRIEAKYYNFFHRLIISSGMLFALGFIVFIELIVFVQADFDFELFLWLNITILILLILLTIRSFNRTRQYLKEVIIDEENFSLILYRFDKQLPIVVVPINEVKVMLNQNFIDRYRRFRLEISIKDNESKFKYNLLHKQYEIGYWNIEELKKIFQLIREKQGKLSKPTSVY